MLLGLKQKGLRSSGHLPCIYQPSIAMKLVNEAAVLDLLTQLNKSDCESFGELLHHGLIRSSREDEARANNPKAPRTIFQPLRLNITTETRDTCLIMPASDSEMTSVKVLSAPHTGNLTAVLSFFDMLGNPLGIISATTITAFRTALTVMILFTKYTGCKETLVFFGAGRQTEWHIRLALKLHDPELIKEIVIVNRHKSRSEQLVRSLQEEFKGVHFGSKVLNEVNKSFMYGVNGIFLCTPSSDPLFPHEYLDSESCYFISLIGSYAPHMHEVETETLKSGMISKGSKIFVDNRDACLEESGELIDAKITRDQLIELGELPLNFSLSPKNEGNVIIKAVGMGIMDLIIGHALLQKASQTNLGTEIAW